MPLSAELALEIERSSSIGRLVRQTMAISERNRSESCALRRTNFLLLAIVENLIAAHKAALAEGDGSTIDIVQDALVFAGRRLVKETHSNGRAARAILGYCGQKSGSRPDRDGAVPE